MSIQLSYDTEQDDPPDPLNVERPGGSFSWQACYATWWDLYRKQQGRLRTAISSGNRYKLYPGHIETLRNVVTWARSQGLDMRLTYSLGTRLGGRAYARYPIYSLELQFNENDPADKVFYGLCHCRFPSSEFVRGKIPVNASYRTLLAQIFQVPPEYYAHLPFNSTHDIVGGYRWGQKPDVSMNPEFGVYLGRALYAFWSTLRDRKWSGAPMKTGRPMRTAKIGMAEWVSFYREWYQTDDKDQAY